MGSRAAYAPIFATVVGGALVGGALLVTALVGFAFALDQLRARSGRPGRPAAESALPWWFGYARDLTNLVAVTLAALALGLLGFAPPVALLGAFFATLTVYLIDYGLGRALRVPRARLVVALVGAAVSAPLIAAPGRAALALDTLLRWLYGRG